jgi:uncharacterized protein (DUF927 family)
MGADNPLDRVKASLRGATASGGRASLPASKGRQVAPIPPTAGPPPAHPKLGRASSVWAYRDEGGRPLGYVLRFDKGAEKEIRPLTWREGDGAQGWAWEGFDAPRPLYGLDRLAERPGAVVLIVEGEKAADAAADRFPDLVAVTWPGGAKAVAKADFAPLRGRVVVAWPDADEPGELAANAVVKAARNAEAAAAASVKLPAALPAGWDLVDPWPPGFGPSEAAAAIGAAIAQAERPQSQGRPPPAEPDGSGAAWPPGFTMDPSSGLWWAQGGGDNQWISDPFEVVGEARDASGSGWSVVVRVKARDGRVTTLVIPRASLGNGGNEARNLLADAGLTFETAQGRKEKLTSALMRVKGPRTIERTEVTGWHRGRFVLPSHTIGQGGGEEVLFTGEATSLKYATAGDYETWKREVAGRAVGNPLLMFALSCGFAAPLLRLLDGEGGGFHFRGSSSSGKSTLLVTAGSIWGGDPNGGQLGFGHTWRTTGNALESLAEAHNDTLLCLDEFAQVDPRDAGGAAYMLANGEAKGRLRSDSRRRPQAKWLLLFLSSGEIGLADHVSADGKSGRVAAGQELRLLDISAQAGAGLGIWKTLDAGETAAARSEAVKVAAKAHFGHAGPLFIERLLANRDGLLRDARAHITGFRAQVERGGDSGQVGRAAERFAVVAAAGELAAGLGVVDWPLGAAMASAKAVFEPWAKDFGRQGLREERQIIAAVKAYIETNRASFAPLGADGVAADPDNSEGNRANEARSMIASGYRQVVAGRVRYLFTDAAFARAVAGFNPQEARRALHKEGLLETDAEAGRLTKRVTVDGAKPRLTAVPAAILEYGE